MAGAHYCLTGDRRTVTKDRLPENTEIQILADPEELSRTAAKQFISLAGEVLDSKKTFTAALSGGSTPGSLYSLLGSKPLGRLDIPWEKTFFFWGDERPVPPDHPDSNYRLAYQAWLSKIPVPLTNLHRIRGENPDPIAAARDYEQEIKDFFHLPAGEFPSFDLVLLGMGRDGHTASLFPGSEAFYEKERLVAANWVAPLQSCRITLTLPVINNAARIMFLVQGEDKAGTLQKVLQGDFQGDPLPAQLVRPKKGKVLWLVDEKAARFLDRGNTK